MYNFNDLCRPIGIKRPKPSGMSKTPIDVKKLERCFKKCDQVL